MDPRFNGEIKPNEHDPAMLEAYLPVIYEPDSHAANLLELDNGDLLCVWFNGPLEGHPETNVVLSRLNKGETKWSEPLEIAADPEKPEQNPVVFQEPSGRLWILNTKNEPHNQRTAKIVYRTSDDRGYTWSEEKVLFDDKPGIFLRSPIVVMSNGEWLLPVYYCVEGGHYTVVKISSDEGKTWTEHEVANAVHRVQMSVVEVEKGKLFGMFRSRQTDRIYATESTDFGRTWTPVYKTDMPNNNSSIQLTKLQNGKLALIFNDATLERDQIRWVGKAEKRRRKALRTPLTVALSEDGGKTWGSFRNVQVQDIEYIDHNEVGYSYPSITQTSDGKIHIAYSYLRKTIKHVIVDEAWITENSRAR